MSNTGDVAGGVIVVLDAWRDMARVGHLDRVPAALRNEVRSQFHQTSPWSPHARAVAEFFLESGHITSGEVTEERDTLAPGAVPPRQRSSGYIGPLAATAIAGGLTYMLVELL